MLQLWRGGLGSFCRQVLRSEFEGQVKTPGQPLLALKVLETRDRIRL